MNPWPAIENDETPMPYQATEQEISWLLPQSLASLAGELAENHEPIDNPATLRLFMWVRSVSGLDRPR
ncbi:hypothetical protein [Pseudomonas graminis]|uniref:Uncharacterized protein n=1 Tax=Pseudomonas graminis TaxID=158627 RepID=A0A1C2E298_9PSED|nr:hypothetical protein [Pseudomonas graminis]OCX21137.1 hypothetical protein BBI10_11060 [Pseudomonas graminis]